MIIYDDHTWWSSHDDHIWWSYMMMIWESSGSHLGVIWGSSGRHLGVIWEPFGSHLGSIWETSGRMEAEEASGGQISYYVPHSRTECKSSIKILEFYEVFLRVPSIMTAYLRLQDLRAGSVHGSQRILARPLYQDRQEPLQLKTVWGVYIYGK